LLAAGRQRFGFNASDVWSVFHSFAFDYSVWEVWGALAHGGCAVIVPNSVRKSPELFAALIRSEGITVLSQTPSAFTSLITAVEDFGAPPPSNLRLIVFGGERLDLTNLRVWYEHAGVSGPELANMYGITETTVHVTARRIDPNEVTAASLSPIGAPLPGAEIYTLNHRLSRTPIGVEGELVVGGGGLARGYVGQPALTALRFVPNRLTKAGGARCYRSGDLGRRLATEDLVFNGRRDGQLKVRGYRVELSEVSAALASYKAVLEQAVIVRRGSSAAEDSIAAFVVPSPEQRVSEPELRAHLAARLPSYMVPATICVVDALPVTANGKLDTAALLAHSADTRTVNRSPRTDTERRIAEIWNRLLGERRSDIDENFFECGGHSLLATRLAVDMREAFDRELSVRAVFECPSIAELARLIDAAAPRATDQAISKIGRVSRLTRSGHGSRGGSR